MASLAILASLGSLAIKHHLLYRRGMASKAALLASLGSLHVDAFGHVGIV